LVRAPHRRSRIHRHQVEANGGFFKHYGQESQRFSAMLDPRRWRAGQPLTALLWALTLPWFRIIVPLLCHYLDRADEHRGYAVCYHVLARRAVRASGNCVRTDLGHRVTLDVRVPVRG
jgi:hypothetical protein